MKTFKVKLLIVLLSVAGCGNYKDVKNAPSEKPIAQVVKTKLDFATIKKEILKPNCIECHEGRHIAYESYAVVKASLSGIINRVTTKNTSLLMPKGGPALSKDAIAKLKEWMAAGAPEFAEESKEDVKEPSEPVVSGIDFKMIKEKVLKPNCIACHTHFNDYEVVKRKSGSILSLVLSDKMPFPRRKGQDVKALSKEDKEMLMSWVGEGSPEEVGDSNLELPPAELKPNWVSLRNNIFGPKCIQCHNSYGPRGPTFMGTHKELREWFKKSPKLFDFENPEESHFIGALIGRVDDDEFFFDPMPFNTSFDDVLTDLSPVSTEEIEVIKKWIELKLPYNEEDL
mgnify:CR=1 FL=1